MARGYETELTLKEAPTSAVEVKKHAHKAYLPLEKYTIVILSTKLLKLLELKQIWAIQTRVNLTPQLFFSQIAGNQSATVHVLGPDVPSSYELPRRG